MAPVSQPGRSWFTGGSWVLRPKREPTSSPLGVLRLRWVRVGIAPQAEGLGYQLHAGQKEHFEGVEVPGAGLADPQISDHVVIRRGSFCS